MRTTSYVCTFYFALYFVFVLCAELFQRINALKNPIMYDANLAAHILTNLGKTVCESLLVHRAQNFQLGLSITAGIPVIERAKILAQPAKIIF
jgi:hypothetical protein